LRNLATANVVGVLWAAAMFAWFFLSALYLQLVLGYSPLQVGLAFLPSNLIMGAFSIGLSAKLVMRFGLRAPLATGLLLAAPGLAVLASLAASRTNSLRAGGDGPLASLVGGYHAAFLVGAIFAAAAAAVGAGLLRAPAQASAYEREQSAGALAAAEVD